MSAPAPSPDSRRLQTARCSEAAKSGRDPCAGAHAPRLSGQPLGHRERAVGRIRAKFDEQERAAIGQQAHRLESLGAREVGQVMIKALERLRTMFQDPRHLVGRQVDVVEAEHHQREPSRTRHQPERRGQRNRRACLPSRPARVPG